MGNHHKKILFGGGESERESSAIEEQRFSLRREIGKKALLEKREKHQGLYLKEKTALIATIAALSFSLFMLGSEVKNSKIAKLSYQYQTEQEIGPAEVGRADFGPGFAEYYQQRIEQGELACEYINLGGEGVGCLELEYYPVFTRQVFISPLLGNFEMPEKATFLWMPASGYLDLRSSDPERISFRQIPNDGKSFDLIEVSMKDCDQQGELIELSAVYGKSIISDYPRPEASFVWDDKDTRFVVDDFITDYHEYPPGTDKGMDMIREIVAKSESVYDLLSVVNSQTRSPFTGKAFTVTTDKDGPHSTKDNVKDIQIIKELKGDCTGRAIITYSLFEKFNPNFEPSLVLNSTEYGLNYVHLELQTRTDDGRYVCIDPATTAMFGRFASMMTTHIQAPLDNLIDLSSYVEMKNISGIKQNVKVNYEVPNPHYASKLNSLDEEILFQKNK